MSDGYDGTAAPGHDTPVAGAEVVRGGVSDYTVVTTSVISSPAPATMQNMRRRPSQG